jgi:hypothetical protein
MSVEILLLVLLGAITLLAYMVAINSHGSARLAFSYLLATVILAVTVWATVQYVNTDINAKNMEEFKKLESEKQKAEDQMKSQEQQYSQAMRTSKERLAVAAKLHEILTNATGLATLMINTDLHDMSMDLDAMVGRSVDTKHRSDQTLADFEKIKVTDSLFSESASLIRDGLKTLTEASQYYYLYFKAEDAAQEELRERIMRQKARIASETLQKAGSQITSLTNQ